MRISRNIGAALTLVVALATPGVAGQVERLDLDLYEDVADRVQSYTRYTVFDSIEAAVENGIVTLDGKVTMPYKRIEIERRAAEVDGVREVRNRIEVLPTSLFDDELRVLAARAIYGDVRFAQYNLANAPIHILVERGRITLTGVVLDNVERRLAHSLVSTLGAFRVTNDLRTDAEVRAELAAIS